MKRILIGLLLATVAFAQPSQQGFDVASIKLSDPSSHATNFGISPSGSFIAQGIDLRTLIANAYDVRGFQVSGGPGWAGTDRYDIVTKEPSGGPSGKMLDSMTDEQRNEFRDRMMGKLRLLLADRFQLKFHRESKEMTVYALVVSKGGSKLEAAADGESNLNVRRTNDAKTAIIGEDIPMAPLVRYLAGQVGRDVLDQTGLTGKYNFKFSYSPDMNRPSDIAGQDAPRVDMSGPSIFTALAGAAGASARFAESAC